MVGIGPESLWFESGCNWYALYTRHQHEKNVARVLSCKGFEVFLPLYNATHRWSDRCKQLSLPLFPCYVFLYGGLDRRPQILATPGVHSFVEFGGSPAVVREDEVEAIRRALENSACVVPHPFLKHGDWVRIRSGPLEGIQGILVRTKNRCRLVLSVEMLEKSVAVEVEAAFVERISQLPRTVAPRLVPATALR